MLYVFHVDTGTMMTFDMNLALESVDHLKNYVERACKIPADKQVLLVSGGECLDPNSRVCSYSAGTDTNPIFLFSKSVIESVTPPCPSIDYGSDLDLKEQVDTSLVMPATYSTVVARAQLAQQFHELAREQTKICEKLVHDQHLQQQGWAAVVANLEDITVEFKKRSDAAEKSLRVYIDERAPYLEFVKNFNYDLQTLAKIPILPQLLSETNYNVSKEKSESSDEVPEDEERTELGNSNETECNAVSLLQWISSADNNSSIEILLDQSQKGLEQFDDRVVTSLEEEVKTALETADKSHMKEVKGLGDRLYGLEQLMCEAKRLVQEQSDLAQAFLQNQNRASNLGDTSILPDLCTSHRRQLLVMLQNHQQLRDIRRRCTRAKEELSVNLYHRLKWVMYVENKILDADQRLVIYHENLRRLRRHLEVLQQVHLAPATYLSAVAEVVRRRTFSQAFLLWASELACHMLTIHNEEVTRRKDFQVQFEGHFLNTLFPGMEDSPPSFATQAPSIFDSSLPKLTIEDVEKLKAALPELCENLIVTDLTSVTQFFLIKSASSKVEDKTDDRGVEEKLVQVVTEVGLASNLDQGMLKPNDSETCLSGHATITYIKDLDKGCESETDTEEFEKVGQSPMELHSYSTTKENPTSPRVGTQDAATLTEENLQSSRNERDKLKSILMQMAALSHQAIGQLKEELNQLKAHCLTENNSLGVSYVCLNDTIHSLQLEHDLKEREIVQRITVDHELEISDCRKLQQSKDEEIKSLRDENSCLEDSLKKIQDESKLHKEEFDLVLKQKDVEKEKAVKEVNENLTREYKTEMESLRSRFRLMSNMERSPSDSSLEKIDSMESIVARIKEKCAVEKQEAIKKAAAEEEAKWQRILEEDKQMLIHDALKSVVEEKDRQIELLRERENNLRLECLKLKSTIHQLAENEAESILIEKYRDLENEKNQLEAELCMEKSRHAIQEAGNLTVDMSQSVAVLEGKVDASTSPIKKERMTRSQAALVQSGSVSIGSCNPGDPVMVLWNTAHQNYVIIQASSHIYFLHPDYLDVLGLSLTSENRKIYCIGEVIDKEYCHAKKAENRYKVPRGTKFYRVKIRPAPPCQHREQHSRSPHRNATIRSQTEQMSQSQSAVPTQTEENISTGTGECHSLPASPIRNNPDVSTTR